MIQADAQYKTKTFRDLSPSVNTYQKVENIKYTDMQLARMICSDNSRAWITWNSK